MAKLNSREAAATAAKRQHSARQSGHRPVLLLVDDEPMGLRVLSSIFREAEYELVVATCGAAAIELVRGVKPDLVMLDVMMPGMDGFEVCRRIRALPDVAEVPILLVTALDDRQSRLEGLKAGADDFISKPIDRDEVRARVRTVTRLNRFGKLQGEIVQSRLAMQELSAHSARQEGLRRVDRAILGASSAREIASAVLPLLRDLIPHEHSAIYKCDSHRKSLTLLAAQLGAGPPSERLDRVSLKELGITLGMGSSDGFRPVVRPLPKRAPLPPLLEAFRAAGAGTLLAVSLGLKDRLIGVLLIGTRTRIRLTGPRAKIAQEVGDILSLALAHAELLESVTRGRSQLEFLSRRLLQVREDESRHIARELHDEIGQFLAVLNFSLRGIQQGSDASPIREQIAYCVDVVGKLLAKVRGLSLDLHPPLLDDFGLVTALRRYISSVVDRVGLAVTLEADESIDRFERGIETVCYRVIQEALTNALRHGGAHKVRIRLSQESEALQLLVEDDGHGFDPEAAMERAARGASLGLLGMRERVSLVGGELGIVSAPGQGTQIRVSFPLDRPQP